MNRLHHSKNLIEHNICSFGAPSERELRLEAILQQVLGRWVSFPLHANVASWCFPGCGKKEPLGLELTGGCRFSSCWLWVGGWTYYALPHPTGTVQPSDPPKASVDGIGLNSLNEVGFCFKIHHFFDNRCQLQAQTYEGFLLTVAKNFKSFAGELKLNSIEKKILSGRTDYLVCMSHRLTVCTVSLIHFFFFYPFLMEFLPDYQLKNKSPRCQKRTGVFYRL